MHPPSLFLLLLLLTSLLSLTTALPHHQSPSPLHSRSALSDCRDLFDYGLNATCWDTLGMEAWMKNWNTTASANKTCRPNELWANCFMREAGVTGIEAGTLGCAQVGPNTCPEPTSDVLVFAGVEEAYGAYNIWSVQNFMTYLYNDLIGTTGLSTIQPFYANSSVHPITGKSLLASILVADTDPRTQMFGLMVMTNIPIPGVTNDAIASVGDAQKVLGGVLASYLNSFMTNFTLGGFVGMARDGKMI